MDIVWVPGRDLCDEDALVPGGGLLSVRRVPGPDGWTWVARWQGRVDMGRGAASARDARAAAEQALRRLRATSGH
jgi:hypothetical protein